MRVERLAVLKDDITKFNLPPLKVKAKDPRKKGRKAKARPPDVTSKRLALLRAQERRLNREWLKHHAKAPRRAAKVRTRYFRCFDALIKEYDRIVLKTTSQERPGATKREGAKARATRRKGPLDIR